MRSSGNPPFLGGQKITGAFGHPYREYLVGELAGGTRGSADLVAYFFRRVGELVEQAGSLGLVATNTIAQGDTRSVGLDVLLEGKWVIFRATKSEPWPGEAALYVSHVWACKGWHGSGRLTSSLEQVGRVSGDPEAIRANEGLAFQGAIPLGKGFLLDPDEAVTMLGDTPGLADVIKPYVVAEDLTSRPDQSASRWIIDFSDWPAERAQEYREAWEIVERRVKPDREKNKRKARRERWWQFAEPAKGLYTAIDGFPRVLLGPMVAKYWSVSWMPSNWVYAMMAVVFTFQDDGHAAVLSSTFHDAWARKWSGSLKFDLRYSPTDCFRNFPFPDDVAVLEEVGDRYLAFRKKALLAENQGLTKVYNRVHEHPDDISERIEELRRLRRELDRAVADAYGWADLDLDHDFRETPLGLRYTISEAVKTEALDRLLELNHARYAEEVAQGLHAKGAKKRGSGKRAVPAEQLEL